MARSGLIFSASTRTSSASTKLSPSLEVDARVDNKWCLILACCAQLYSEKASAACLSQVSKTCND